MTETSQWTEGYMTYTVWCQPMLWSFSVTIEFSPTFAESEIDECVQAMANFYSTLHPVTNITKTYTGTGVSSYDFTYTNGVGTDVGDGITQFNNSYPNFP